MVQTKKDLEIIDTQVQASNHWRQKLLLWNVVGELA